MDQLPPLPPVPASVASTPSDNPPQTNYLPYIIAIIFLVSIISSILLFRFYFLNKKPTVSTPVSTTISEISTPTVPTTTPSPKIVRPTIRIDAGSEVNTTDHLGNIWLSDRGFTGGSIVTRPPTTVISQTLDQFIYFTEHWGMTGFSQPVPNGRYQVILHFAETSPNITAPKQRLFNYNIEGTLVNNVDVFVESGGSRFALLKNTTVNVQDGSLDIIFVSLVENTEINGIEIIPQSEI